jgi:hypothetical protein
MQAGIDALGAGNIATSAGTAAQAALDDGGTVQDAGRAAAAAAGGTLRDEGYDVDEGVANSIGSAISDEASHWGQA